MPTPADVHIRDTITAILRDIPIYMDAEEISTQLARDTGRTLHISAVWEHCNALAIAGYLHKTQALPTTWAYIHPAMASTHRRYELIVEREIAGLEELVEEEGQAR